MNCDVSGGSKKNKDRFYRRMRAMYRMHQSKPVLRDTPTSTTDDFVLRVTGTLTLDVGRIRLPESDMEEQEKQIHLGAWIGRSSFASAKRNADDTFELSVPFSKGDPDLVKLEVYCVMEDPETGLTKPFPLVSSMACLHSLSKSGTADVIFLDPFENPLGCKASLKLQEPFDASVLRPSSLRSAKLHNEAMEAMAQRVVDTISSNNFHVPPPAQGFEVGLTYLPSGGAQEILGIPPVATHYAVLSRYTSNIDRPLPHALLAYYLQQSLSHSGLTISQLNALADEEFAREAGDVLWGLTADAGWCPYEPDRTLSVGMQIDMKGIHLGLTPVTTENIGLPFAESSFIGRESVDPSTTIGDQVKQKTNKKLGLLDNRRETMEQEFKRYLETLIQRAAQRGNKKVAFTRSLLLDDCETSAMGGELAASTVKKGNMTVFEEELRGDPLFKNWTSECFKQCQKFYTRLQDYLRRRQIDVCLMVGLAGGASAGEINEGKPETESNIDAAKNLNGHCFGVLRHVNPATNKLYVRLLEGTTRIRIHTPAPDVIYTCKKMDSEKPLKLPLDKFQILLCQSLSGALALTKSVVRDTEKSAAPHVVPGLTRESVVLPCLHSLGANSDIPFYKWCVYTGLSCDTGVGSLLLDDTEGSSILSTGCRPYQMASPKLQAVSAELPSEMSALGEQILDEVWPPIASKATFRSVMQQWEMLTPLSEVNANLSDKRIHKDTTYSTVACMESPNDPGCVEPMHRLNCLVINEANRLNLALPDSDGIFVTVDRIGTGISKTLHIPHRSATLTYMRSLRQVQFKLGWPGATDPDAVAKPA